MPPSDGQDESLDPLAYRVSDAEREAVADLLRQAAGDGRIDLEELDERLSTTYAARTRGDLIPVTADLPSGRPGPSLEKRSGAAAARRPESVPDRVVPGPETATHVAVMSGVDRRGDWLVPERTTAICFWGGVNLDMREARFAAREVTVTVTAIMGGLNIVVDEDTEVVMEGVGIMGGFTGPSSVVPPDERAVTLRVKGLAIMGGVSVSRKPRDLPESRRHRLH